MTCQQFQLPGGGTAIVCGPTKRCSCGARATLECDWIVPSKTSGTCDKGICARCTHSPKPGKDLCPKHSAEWKNWKPSREGK